LVIYKDQILRYIYMCIYIYITQEQVKSNRYYSLFHYFENLSLTEKTAGHSQGLREGSLFQKSLVSQA